MRPFILFCVLEAFFLLLSGQFHNTFLMAAGVVCCALTTLITMRMGIVDREGMPVQHWARSVTYFPTLVWEIVLANIDMAKIVLNPNLKISPRIITVPHELKTAFGQATYANSITLTPGTVTMELEDDHFIVHAISEEAAHGLLTGSMHDRVARMEQGEK